ncbi:MAG: M20/M25/M40 family metallo-hydrolase, partial [Candidatus Cloacimonetes bacterium]|nr:M20/M25/M40 family metallo-hydrolase [Candidatus Cloacimonadota bacterium]
LIDYFISLIKIDSESKNEKALASKIAKDLRDLGAEVTFDNANEKTGGNIGNLYGYFSGNIDKKPILLCAHMDTVVPGNGIKPQIKDDRIVTDGTTILGADDKSGIAEIIWAIKEINEANEDHAPIEVLLTISEEIGLLGAKLFDLSNIKSEFGYALDSHKVGHVVTGAPSQNSMKFTIHGKESHAGAAPECGVSAIQIAAEAISKMKLGRIDEETTCNIGIIKGGTATNIIPKEVILKAEVRSHNAEKLQKITNDIKQTLLNTAAKYKLDDFQASVESIIQKEYPAFVLKDDDPCILIAKKATENIGLPFKSGISGGGSDANIFNFKGLKMAVVGSGMEDVHTVNEFIKFIDLKNGVKWVKEVIREYSRE